jgi:antitoxin component YwqK of YwqJK toxin-antitoxin module
MKKIVIGVALFCLITTPIYAESLPKNGIYKALYPNGHLKIEAYYRNGMLNGLYKEFL